jgi:predicted enzyme related to lactoylglutathione lyase
MVPSGEGGIGGGIMASPSGQPYVTVYVQVDDLSGYLAKAEGLGAKSLVQPTDIPGGGSFAVFQDPDGNMVGLFKA